MIKLRCTFCGHEKVAYSPDDLFPEDKICILCKGKMIVANLDEIVMQDMNAHLDRKLKESFEGLGLEGTIEAIKRQEYLYQAYKEKVIAIFKKDMFKDINYIPNNYIDSLTMEISNGRNI
jgi:hypothetical protein